MTNNSFRSSVEQRYHWTANQRYALGELFWLLEAYIDHAGNLWNDSADLKLALTRHEMNSLRRQELVEEQDGVFVLSRLGKTMYALHVMENLAASEYHLEKEDIEFVTDVIMKALINLHVITNLNKVSNVA